MGRRSLPALSLTLGRQRDAVTQRGAGGTLGTPGCSSSTVWGQTAKGHLGSTEGKNSLSPGSLVGPPGSESLPRAAPSRKAAGGGSRDRGDREGDVGQEKDIRRGHSGDTGGNWVTARGTRGCREEHRGDTKGTGHGGGGGQKMGAHGNRGDRDKGHAWGHTGGPASAVGEAPPPPAQPMGAERCPHPTWRRPLAGAAPRSRFRRRRPGP